jgi:hypothetical protein
MSNIRRGFSHKSELEKSCSSSSSESSNTSSSKQIHKKIDSEDYLNLVASKIVLDVLKNSLKILNSENGKLNRSFSDEEAEYAIKSRKFFDTKRWYDKNNLELKHN